MSIDAFVRTRNTAATRLRLENLRNLVVEISTREMSNDDIATFLNFSSSGAKQYTRDLHNSGVIHLSPSVGNSRTAKAIYQITNDADFVKEFLAEIEPSESNNPIRVKERRSNRSKHLDDAGRHFHILADDDYHPARVSRITPAVRDPLVEALFGAAVKV